MSLHARVAPSSMAAHVQCGAYLRMNEPYADEPRTPEQLEGDAAHWAALMATSTGELLPVGTMTPQGLTLTEEMVEGAALWASTLGGYGIAEMPVFCTSIHPTECYGTPDWRRFDPIEGVLRIWDYKFGRRYVEVFECWQLLAYLAGCLDEMEQAGLVDQHLWVEFGIVQPRSYHPSGPVRSYRFRASDARALINRMNEAAHRALEPNAPARVGPACYDCRARHECVALQSATSYLMASDVVLGDTPPLSPAAMGAELQMLDDAADLIEARRAGLKAQAEAVLRGGERVPGYALESVKGRLTWRDDAAITAAATTADMLGVQIRKPLQLITPTQALAQGLPLEILSTYAHNPGGGVRLTRETNITSRKAFGANKA